MVILSEFIKVAHVWTCSVLIVFPPVPKKGMVKFSRKGHFQRAVTCKEGTFQRTATCKEGTVKPASFIFFLVLSSFTFISQNTNPLEAGCCYCQHFKLKHIKKIFLLKILISTCSSKRGADFYAVFVLIVIGINYFHLLYMVHCSKLNLEQ